MGPLSRYGDVHENRVTGERAVVLRGEEGGADQPALVHLTVKPGGAVVGEHVHPRVQERFRVVSGTLGTRLDGLDRTLGAGDEATVPAGVPHDWWNAGDDDASVLVELSPPDPRFEAMIATLFGLANAGKTNAKGLPGPLQLALFRVRDYCRDHAAWPPPERFAAPFRAVTVLAPSPRRAAATMADAGLRWSAAFAILRRVDLGGSP